MQNDFQLKAYLEGHRATIDIALKEYIERFCLSDRMLEPVLYAVSAGGKRVRPILCLAACEAVGGETDKAMAVACALEMIHTYSLIHDDLPALDNDNLRRGHPTCHIKFGEATAILAGDALLTMAFEVIGETGSLKSENEAGRWLQVLNVVAKAAGCRGMIEGQARDLAFERIKIDQVALEALHRLKTGAMIRAAVHTGGLLGDGSAEQIAQLTEYADNIGLAFQVIDDVLNVKGDPSRLGKAVGTDSTREKNTYPALLGLEQSEAYAFRLIDLALKSLADFGNEAEPLRAIARYIVRRDH